MFFLTGAIQKPLTPVVQAESAEAIHDSVMGKEVLELLFKLKGAVCKNVCS